MPNRNASLPLWAFRGFPKKIRLVARNPGGAFASNLSTHTKDLPTRISTLNKKIKNLNRDSGDSIAGALTATVEKWDGAGEKEVVPGSTFWPALLTSAMLWFSFPPIGLWPLAWFAPIPLLHLVGRKKLAGKRPYLSIGLSGFLYWLATFYFVPLPHPVLWLGWLVVSGYLSLFTVLMFWSARVMVHRWNLPMFFAAPIAWTGDEWLRCNVLTGMGLVCLSHSQYQQSWLIQIADLFGAYALTFSIVLVASTLLYLPLLTTKLERRTNTLVFGFGLAWLACVVAYGAWSLSRTIPQDESRQLVVALVQGSIDTRLGERQAVQEEKFAQYSKLTVDARQKWPDLELIIWPESGLPIPDLLPDGEVENDPEVAENAAVGMKKVWGFATGYPVVLRDPIPMLTGTVSGDLAGEQYFNSAILIDRQGVVTDRYFKNHRVMYGEYFPVLNLIPAFRERMPEIEAGDSAEVFEVDGVRLAPLICFETTVPHLVRKHLNTLRSQGREPDALVNPTNDGWFFGTSCLDFHLACNVFRAVEMRKPNLVCANTGFSAEIDSSGRLLQCGPRRDVEVIRAVVTPESRNSLYRETGDWIPFSLALVTLIAAAYGWIRR